MTDTQTTGSTETMSALDRLVAKAEIYDVIMRYCRGVDRSDPELVKSVYHEDGYDDHGAMFQGPGWEFSKFFAPREDGEPSASRAVHFIGNHYVEFQSADVAFSEASFVTYSHAPTDEHNASLFTFCGRYIDRFERRSGEWKVAHRICLHEWNRVEQFPSDPPHSVRDFAAAFVQAAGAPDDATYHWEWLDKPGARPGANPTNPPVFPGRGTGPLIARE